LTNGLNNLAFDDVKSAVGPEEKAAVVLAAFWQESDYPVDPAVIAWRMGVEVFIDELPPQMSGALIKQTEMPAKILIRSDEPSQRRRFTCAHEIGHFVEHGVYEIDAKYEYLDLRVSVGGSPIIDEVFANQFAASLLMPKDVVEQFWSLNKDANDLATYLDVSLSAMDFRLMNLGLKS
jgi:Zn-dependent peptidase ImmA (M78 family)